MGASVVARPFSVTDLAAGVKRCANCKEVKSLGEFSTNRTRRGTTHAAYCRPCQAVKSRQSRQRDPERHRAKAAEYKRLNPERHAKYAFDAQLVKACRAAGITPERYRHELSIQGGVCAICRSPQRNARMARLVIDHDHVTGEFRGLLCSHCNAALGQFGDNAAIMEEAIAYLRRSNQLFKVVTLPSA